MTISHSPGPGTGRAWVVVDLGALVANARAYRGLAGAPLIPVVKADAYGLGVARVVQALERTDPWGYAVATVDEGEQLRRIGISRPVLVLSPLASSQASRFLAANLRPAIGDLDALDTWLGLGSAAFHLEIDTGMARSGFPWSDPDLIGALATRLAAAPGWEGAFCHFHSAERDAEATRLQWARFQDALRVIGRRPPLVHAANSGAGVSGIGRFGDLARPGLYLYGGAVGGHQPLPVVSFHARVVAVRRIHQDDTVSYGATWRASHPTTIATVGAGYADGVPLGLSNRGRMLIGGTAHPIAGRVTMDMTMLDMGDAAVRVGDVATIFGPGLSLEEQAEATGTIPYTLLTGLADRVIRLYREES